MLFNFSWLLNLYFCPQISIPRSTWSGHKSKTTFPHFPSFLNQMEEFFTTPPTLFFLFLLISKDKCFIFPFFLISYPCNQMGQTKVNFGLVHLKVFTLISYPCNQMGQTKKWILVWSTWKCFPISIIFFPTRKAKKRLLLVNFFFFNLKKSPENEP